MQFSSRQRDEHLTEVRTGRAAHVRVVNEPRIPGSTTVMLAVYGLIINAPTTLDSSRWFFGTSVLAIALGTTSIFSRAVLDSTARLSSLPLE